MSTFGKPQMRQKKSKWGPPEEKFIMSNVANIISPNLRPEFLHAALLRFQFEEIQYKMDHLYDEVPNILYGDNSNENRSQIPLEVRARDALINERRQVLDEIEKIYPAFELPPSIKFSVNKPVKKIVLPNQQSINLLMGTKCTNLSTLEQNYHVRISLRLQVPKEGGETESYALLIGNNKDDVNRCYHSIQKLIQTSHSQEDDINQNSNPEFLSNESLNTNQNAAQPHSKAAENDPNDPKNYRLSFNPDEEYYPWSDLVTSKISYARTIDQIEGEVNALMKEIDTMSSTLEDEHILSLEELKRYSFDITTKDISTILIKEPPPNLD